MSFGAASNHARPSGDLRLLEYSQGFCVKHSVGIGHRTVYETPHVNASHCDLSGPLALLGG
jgi:hypothetical protein